MAPNRLTNTSKETCLSEKATTSAKSAKKAMIPRSKQLITKIHGKYYDLTNFKHPGGPIPIALIDGRDGTELFESHHMFTSKDINEILINYELHDHPDTIKSSNVYDWEATKSDPFTLELKAAARKALGKDIKATLFRIAEISVLFTIAMW